jgi:hypothetical protein
MSANIVFSKEHSEQGSVTVIALIILVVLTLIGISATRTSNVEMRIAANVIPFKQDIYLAQGGLHREAGELGRGEYPVTNVVTASTLADETGFPPGAGTGSLPGDNHELPDIDGDGQIEPYDFEVRYVGYYPPPTGYSVIHFSRYDFEVDSTGGNVFVSSRYYKIGPRAE